jgi:hypothetical protein
MRPADIASNKAMLNIWRLADCPVRVHADVVGYRHPSIALALRIRDERQRRQVSPLRHFPEGYTSCAG